MNKVRQQVSCRLCERLAVDGLPSSKVDLQKFSNWCQRYLGTDLAEELQPDDLFCSFCVWDAELLLESDGAAGKDNIQFLWWPGEKTQNPLRSYYLDGKVKPCFVHLEKIFADHGKHADDKEKMKDSLIQHWNEASQKFKCPYCYYLYRDFYRLRWHIYNGHRDTLKCKVRNCYTFFHTIQEKEKHEKKFHAAAPRLRRYFECIYCKQCIRGSTFDFKIHIDRRHSKVAIRCRFPYCVTYFHTKEELDCHFEARHKKADALKKFQCHLCPLRTRQKGNLEIHIIQKHFEKRLKCPNCPKLFTNNRSLLDHTKRSHSFKNCNFCCSRIRLTTYSKHSLADLCKICRTEFPCAGILKKHMQTCREVFPCELCLENFKTPSDLKFHRVSKHYYIKPWKGLKYKKFGFKCVECKQYYANKSCFNGHLKRVHSKETKYECAHCPAKYTSLARLPNHLSMVHGLMDTKYECADCSKKFYLLPDLRTHVISHLLIDTPNRKVRCHLCPTLLDPKKLKFHLMYKHDLIKLKKSE